MTSGRRLVQLGQLRLGGHILKFFGHVKVFLLLFLPLVSLFSGPFSFVSQLLAQLVLVPLGLLGH